MNFDSSIRPVWQLPVVGEGNASHPSVPLKSKYHCYVDEKSLCGGYTQDTELFDEGITIESGEIASNPQFACKRCLRVWQRRYCPEAAEAALEAQRGENDA